MSYDLTTEIPLAMLDDYLGDLKASLGLDDKVCSQLRQIQYAGSKDRLIFEVKYKDKFESEYGYIAMVKNQKKDAFSCVYVFHRLKMKLAKRRVETRTLRRLFGIFPIGEDVSVHYENVKLGTNDIDAIKETYMRHKALQALRDQGIIQEITYDP